MKNHVKGEIRPLMDELVKEGMCSPADKQGAFFSNLNCVPKPISDRITHGKN